uniref:Uncharacterized protein n=1 Tax=Vespula pensylvanica TaxID=30213 RepID=A0A834JV38_VESPE|nr:hypothetical protein H0235_016761 [Vespula pensylvanica]
MTHVRQLVRQLEVTRDARRGSTRSGSICHYRFGVCASQAPEMHLVLRLVAGCRHPRGHRPPPDSYGAPPHRPPHRPPHAPPPLGSVLNKPDDGDFEFAGVRNIVSDAFEKDVVSEKTWPKFIVASRRRRTTLKGRVALWYTPSPKVLPPEG